MISALSRILKYYLARAQRRWYSQLKYNQQSEDRLRPRQWLQNEEDACARTIIIIYVWPFCALTHYNYREVEGQWVNQKTRRRPGHLRISAAAGPRSKHRDVEPMMVKGWPSDADGGPTLNHHWFKVYSDTLPVGTSVSPRGLRGRACRTPNPQSAEIILYKPWRLKGFTKFEVIINVLVLTASFEYLCLMGPGPF